jgi:two-component system sensor histidine kinase DegS
MSALHIQWADFSTSRENKRRSVEPFAEEEDADTDERQPELLSAIRGAIEQERHRIGEDLHDSVAQDMALALHKLEHVQHLLEQSQLYQAFQEVTHVTRILEIGLHNLRSSIAALLPQQCNKQTAFAALMTLVQEYQQDHPELQLDWRIESHELLTQIPSGLEVPIFRFVQQALNNVWQHAAATHIIISLMLRSKVLSVEVCDNGKGCSFQTDVAGDESPVQLGLGIMREHIEHMGGRWEIKSQPEGGTCVRAIFPLEES